LLERGIETPIPGISAFVGARKAVDNKNTEDKKAKTKAARDLFCFFIDLIFIFVFSI
jgi:hypothetical protein